MNKIDLIREFVRLNNEEWAVCPTIEKISKLIPVKFANVFLISKKTENKMLVILTMCGDNMKHVTMLLSEADIASAKNEPNKFRSKILIPMINLLEMISGSRQSYLKGWQ